MKLTFIAITYTVLLAALVVLGWNLKTLKDDLGEIGRERVAVEEPKDTSFVFDTTLSIPGDMYGYGDVMSKIRSFHTNGVSAIIEEDERYLYLASDGYVVAVLYKTAIKTDTPVVWHCTKPSLKYGWRIRVDDPAIFEKLAIYNISEAKVLHPRSCECLFNHCSR